MKRRFLLVALMAVLALALTGCGQSGGSKSVKTEKKSVYFENNICETRIPEVHNKIIKK